MEFWGYVLVGALVLLMIRAWLLMGKISRFIDDTDYREARKFSDRLFRRS